MVKIGPAFFDSVSEAKIRNRSRGGNFSRSEVLTIAPLFLMLLAFLTITARLFYVQVLRADYYTSLANSNRTRTDLIEAPRGVILDRAGRPLVSNSPSYQIKTGDKFVTIPNDEALKLISQNKKVYNSVQRDYLYKNAFAHAVGYVGSLTPDQVNMAQFSDYGINDSVGRMGLEAQYENLLHGHNGKRLYEVDAQGKFVRELGREEPIPGETLKTTLDADVGVSVENAMKGVGQGAVVVSNPQDGGIIALFSSPSFDPNLFTHDKTYQADGDYKNLSSILTDNDKQPLLNRAISGVYPPGSTFKLVAATAALERGSIKPDTEIEDTGILKVGTFSFGNWYFLQYGRTEGSINIVSAIKRSNDIFFYKAAESTGVDNISAWARQFNLGSKLNIDLPEESKGTVPTVEWKEKTIGEQWYLGDTYNYGIGQGYLLATPLQVNMFTDVFANGGTLYQPHILAGQRKVIKKNFVKSANMSLVREGMAEACDTGGVAFPFFGFAVKNPNLKIDNQDYFKSASDSADMVHVKVACKTGTAEIGGADTKPHAWITVFAPFTHPEIAVTVLVENGGEGSSIAGPIAKKILTDYFEKK